MRTVPINIAATIAEGTASLTHLAKGLFLGGLIGVASGVASALFLYLLHAATAYREVHPWLLFLLPLAGLCVGWVYDRYGGTVAAGTNLLLEQLHSDDTDAPVPFRMAPLVLGGTVITHLFGGSAGREGTAVQMGGALAALLSRPLRLTGEEQRQAIMSGISGGFGSVFGTPLAGAVFGMEVRTIGRIDYAALIPCFVAAYVGDVVCRTLGIRHASYSIGISAPEMTPYRWVLVAIAAALFAAAASAFVWLAHRISTEMQKRMADWVRPFWGGVAVIGLTYLVGTHAYLGLSLPLIAASFRPEGVPLWAFALKLLFTSVTLGSGFKGGEVTPLFCIGATLGAAFGMVTGQPPAFFAALGLVAVFAGAANTPLACILMGVELFGVRIAAPLAAACLIAYALAGTKGIYSAQRVGIPKFPAKAAPSEPIAGE